MSMTGDEAQALAPASDPSQEAVQEAVRSASYPAAIRRIRPAIALAALFSAAVNLLMLTGPLYMLQVYDRVLASGSVPTLQALFAIVVVLYGFLGLYLFLRARLLSRAAYRLDAALAGAAFDRASAARAPLAAAEAAREDTLRDLTTVRGFLASPAMASLFDLPWIPFFLLVVALVHPYLGLLTAAGSLVVLAIAVLSQRAGRRPLALSSQMEAAERDFAGAAKRSADTLAALGMRHVARARWLSMRAAAQAAMQVGGDRGEGFSAASRSFRMLLQSALLTLGAWLVIRQEISPGMIIASSIIAGRALAPVDQVIGAWPALGRARAAHRALMAAMPEAPPEAPEGGVGLPRPEARLEVTGLVCLSPERDPVTGEQRRILDEVTFALRPGDALGVVGASASGKSSLARLLVGAWETDRGEIRLGGARLDQWDAGARGRWIGYLPQRIELLPGTVAENIGRFDPARSDDEVIAAARMAGVHEMILHLPQGYATRVGEGDNALSGGQRQRVGLARAVVGTPPLVVLDEPNSNLDAEGDVALGETVRALREAGSAVVVMAHRPGALAAVNKVMILQNGSVARFGPRDELIPGLPRAPAERSLARTALEGGPAFVTVGAGTDATAALMAAPGPASSDGAPEGATVTPLAESAGDGRRRVR